jgi:hypothetical protein
MHKYHITALVTLTADVPLPKSEGVRSGYAPHHKFENVEYLVSGFHSYLDEQLHYPGETIRAKIGFPSWEFFGDTVAVGDRFKILEMNRLVGEGVVQSIDN